MEIRGLSIEVVRKDIKNLHVGVYPPNGRVRVAAPLRLKDDALRLAVISRLGWIHRKRTEFVNQDRESEREFVTGESHYLAGRRYLLRVIEEDSRPSVRVATNKRIELRVRRGTDRTRRAVVLHQWYHAQLREQLPQLLAKWEAKAGVKVSEVRVRRMKTRWGTCTADAKRIWINLELAKKPRICLEYILVHEMVHLLERQHNNRFRRLMDSLMPSWRLHREVLNRAPLAHEDWGY